MAEPGLPIAATCQCGAAYYSMPDPLPLPAEACFCHCNSCRQMSGALCLASIPLPPGSHPPASLLKKLTAFEFSEEKGIDHYFCPRCGTHMVAQVGSGLEENEDEDETTWYIMCGTLVQPWKEAAKIYQMRHQYIEDTLDGGVAQFLTQGADGKPTECWLQHSGEGGQQLEPDCELLSSTAPPPPSSSSPKDENASLKVHCKCWGIEFNITPPSPTSSKRRTGKPYRAKFCSCGFCRRSTGMDPRVVAFAEVPICDLSADSEEPRFLTPQDFQFGDTLKTYRSSSGTTRGFCSGCGATVLVYRHKYPDVIRIAVGLLEGGGGARADAWLDWTNVPSGISGEE